MTHGECSDNHRGSVRRMRARDRMGLRAAGMAVVGIGLMLLAVAGAVGIGRLTETQETPSAVPVEEDFPAPPLVFTSLSGEQLSLAHYRGQGVLINLWATGCPPCRAEMPMREDPHETMPPRD
jgi:hypothetical protein